MKNKISKLLSLIAIPLMALTISRDAPKTIDYSQYLATDTIGESVIKKELDNLPESYGKVAYSITFKDTIAADEYFQMKEKYHKGLKPYNATIICPTTRKMTFLFFPEIAKQCQEKEKSNLLQNNF